jgi:hypothetical protein
MQINKDKYTDLTSIVNNHISSIKCSENKRHELEGTRYINETIVDDILNELGVKVV